MSSSYHGVAIRTTFAHLKHAFDDDLNVRIGRVRYLDFRTQFADVNDAIFRKRKSLQHEQEVRAVIRASDEASGAGLTRSVQLQDLIREVVVSPFAPTWFESVVRDLMQRFDVQLPLRTSEILLQPFF